MKAKIFIMTLLVMILSAVQGYAQRENRGNTRSRAKSGTSAAQYGSPVPHSGTSSVSGNYRSLVSTAVSIKPQGTVIPVRAQYGTAAGNAPAFCRNVTEGTDRDNIPPFGYAAGEARNSTAPRSYASAAASSVATGFRASSRLFAPSPSLLFQ